MYYFVVQSMDVMHSRIKSLKGLKNNIRLFMKIIRNNLSLIMNQYYISFITGIYIFSELKFVPFINK